MDDGDLSYSTVKNFQNGATEHGRAGRQAKQGRAGLELAGTSMVVETQQLELLFLKTWIWLTKLISFCMEASDSQQATGD
jgi:hypothetical protein